MGTPHRAGAERMAQRFRFILTNATRDNDDAHHDEGNPTYADAADALTVIEEQIQDRYGLDLDDLYRQAGEQPVGSAAESAVARVERSRDADAARPVILERQVTLGAGTR